VSLLLMVATVGLWVELRCIREIFDRLYGKPTNQAEPGGESLNFDIVQAVPPTLKIEFDKQG